MRQRQTQTPGPVPLGQPLPTDRGVVYVVPPPLVRPVAQDYVAPGPGPASADAPGAGFGLALAPPSQTFPTWLEDAPAGFPGQPHPLNAPTKDTAGTGGAVAQTVAPRR